MAKDKRKDPALLKGDAVADQILTEIFNAARQDIPDWIRLGDKINKAADTRDACSTILPTLTPEELYHLVRVAHAGHIIITGRLLERDV